MDQAELRQWEARCIQEAPPRCAAACPLHVDARAVCGHLAAGRPGGMDEAWAVLCRTLPLPGVLARICDAPCRSSCLRSERGGGLAMGELERFCAENATRTPRLVHLPDRGKAVAVCGAGLAGLTAAWDLARKGFSVTLFTHEPVQVLLDRFPDRLSPEVLAHEMGALARLGVTLAPAPEVDRAAAEAALRVFAAVVLDPEQCPYETLGLRTSDPATLATELPGLFAAPRPGTDSPVALAALGRRAAISVERHVQGASLTAGREREGVFATRLFTDISQVADLVPVPVPPAGYGPDAARAEAGRCLNCQCLECVRHCAYLEHYGSYPKVYARRVFNNEAIVMGSRQANEFINSCMLCGLCAQVCPEGFAVADLCRTARQGMVRAGRMPPSAHEFALRDMAFANGEHCALARPAPGQAKSPSAFFPGCQLTASDPGAVERAYAHLRAALPGDCGLLLRCCGAPARWAGREEAADRAAQDLRRDWEGLGRPELVAACPSCVLGLQAELPEARVSSLWEVLAEAGLPVGVAASPAGGRTLAVHDPCASRRDLAQRAALRGLLDRLGVAWTEPVRSGERTECCGFGGLLVHANPPLGAEVARLRSQTAPEDFVTTCAMCRDLLARVGKRSLHLLDLLLPGPDPDPAARPAPGHSERRENRARLKEDIMRTLWPNGADAGPAPAPWAGVAVAFTPEAAARLEERRILKSDVQKVLFTAEGSGRFLANRASGHRLTSHRPVAVTYWVEYEQDSRGGFLVHNAWSHRMQVLEVR